MANEMNYEKMFEMVREQIRKEMYWTSRDLVENPTDEESLGKYNAYDSIWTLIEKLEEKGYENYIKECEEVCKKYEKYGEA